MSASNAQLAEIVDGMADVLMLLRNGERVAIHEEDIASLREAAQRLSGPSTGAEISEAVKRIKDRIDYRLNDCLCEMQPNYDDSITGFNEAWDIMRAIFKEEIAALEAAKAASEG